MISLHLLRYALEISNTRSITKASQNLLLSQPYLSNTIKQLETTLGILLFQRSKRGIELTDDGKLFVKQAQEIIARVDVLESMLLIKPDQSLQVNFSMTRSQRIMKLVHKIINDHMDRQRIVVRVNETNPFQVVEDVRTHTSNFGVLHFFDTQKEYFLNLFKVYELSHDIIYDRQFLLCMSKDSPMRKNAVIDHSVLQKYVVLVYGDYEIPSASYQTITEFSDIVMSKRRIYLQDRGGAMETLSACPNTYMWITGIHPGTLEQYGLILRECANVDVHNIGCSIYYSLNDLNPISKRLYEEILCLDWSEKKE
jgi:hypothetical protein